MSASASRRHEVDPESTHKIRNRQGRRNYSQCKVFHATPNGSMPLIMARDSMGNGIWKYIGLNCVSFLKVVHPTPWRNTVVVGGQAEFVHNMLFVRGHISAPNIIKLNRLLCWLGTYSESWKFCFDNPRSMSLGILGSELHDVACGVCSD